MNVFTWKNPRSDGFAGDVEEDVWLDYDMEHVHSWPTGTPRPEPCLGRSPDLSSHFKVFRFRNDLEQAGYQFVPGSTLISGSWADFLRLTHPDKLAQEDWFRELDRIDDTARRRRSNEALPELPLGTS